MVVVIGLPSVVDFSAYLEAQERLSEEDFSAPSQLPSTHAKLSYKVQDAFEDGAHCGSEALLSFAKEKGIEADKLQIAHFPCSSCEGGTRRGMAARTAIKKGEQLVSAPWKAVISAELSITSEVLSALEVFEGTKLSSAERLAIFLMYHRFRADSELRPYICSLPHNYSSVPLFWDDKQLIAVGQGHLSELGVRTTGAKLYVVQQYNRLLPLLFQRAPELFDPEVHTLPAFLWALQTVKSRNWYVNRQREPKIEYAMLPLGDMINHRQNEPGGGRTSSDGARFELHSGSDYAAGDEVFISYGNHCNMHLLMTYGFQVEGNAVNCTGKPGGTTLQQAGGGWAGKKQELYRHWAASGIGTSSVLPRGKPGASSGMPVQR